MHVEKTPDVGGEAADRDGFPAVFSFGALVIAEVAVVVGLFWGGPGPEVERSSRPGPASIFPLGLGRQAITYPAENGDVFSIAPIVGVLSSFFAQVVTKVDSVKPVDALDGKRVPLEMSAIVAHDRLPLSLCHLMNA